MTTQPQPEPTLRDLANKLDQLTADVDQVGGALRQNRFFLHARKILVPRIHPTVYRSTGVTL